MGGKKGERKQICYNCHWKEIYMQILESNPLGVLGPFYYTGGPLQMDIINFIKQIEKNKHENKKLQSYN